jgi:hypothetical protein
MRTDSSMTGVTVFGTAALFLFMILAALAPNGRVSLAVAAPGTRV